MRRSDSRIKAFGLTIMATLSFMALTAVTAHAENLTDGGKAGVFQIGKSSALVAGKTLTGTPEGSVRILEPGRNLTILCTKLDFTGKFLNENEALVESIFLECEALSLDEKQKLPCTLVGGGIKTVLLALAKKHEGQAFILFEGDPAGAALGTIEYTGAECTLPKTNTIAGSLVGELQKAETVEPLLKFESAIQKLFGDKINYGTLELVLDGSIVLKLTGSHAGLTLGVA
jgi:hypothetical protein